MSMAQTESYNDENQDNQTFDLFEHSDPNAWPQSGMEHTQDILPICCSSPPSPLCKESSETRDVTDLFATVRLKELRPTNAVESKEQVPEQPEPAEAISINSTPDDVWCTCLEVDNPAYGLHKLGTCCRGQRRKSRTHCDLGICESCDNKKPTGGQATACDAIETGHSTLCFFCKTTVGGKEIFNDPEHRDAHFPKKPSTIKLKTAGGKKRKTESDFGICMHRLEMMKGLLDRGNYKAVVETIENARAKAKSEKEAKERADTNPEELLSLTSSEKADEEAVKGDAASDDNDIDDDDVALVEIWRKQNNKVLCNLVYKTTYDQQFVANVVKGLGAPDDWTIHTQANVGDRALSGRWPPNDKIRQDASSIMRKDGCDHNKIKNVEAKTDIALTQFTTHSALQLLKKGTPSQIARNHHYKSVDELSKMSPKAQVLKVYEETRKWAWTFPAAEVLGTTAADVTIQTAMGKEEPSVVPLLIMAYKFKTESLEKSTHYVAFFSILLVDPKSKTAWLLSSQNSLEPGMGVEYVKLPLEKRVSTMRTSQYILDRKKTRKKAKSKEQSKADPNADSAVLMELEAETIKLTVKKRLNYVTARNQRNIIEVIQRLRPEGSEWTIFEAAEEGNNELDKQWPGEADKEEIEKWLVEHKCDHASDKIQYPNIYLARYASEVALTILQEETAPPQLAARIQQRGLQSLRAMTPTEQAKRVYTFSKDCGWSAPHIATLGTEKATKIIKQAMRSGTISSLQIDMIVYRFDRNELTDVELLDEKTNAFYDLVPFYLLVHPIIKTIWLVNGGSQVFEEGDTEFIKLPLKLRQPTTSVMQADIDKMQAEKKRTEGAHEIKKKDEIEEQPEKKTRKSKPRKRLPPTKQPSKIQTTTQTTATKARANDEDREQIDLTGTETADQPSSEKPNVHGKVDWTELNENGYVLIKYGAPVNMNMLEPLQRELKEVRGLKNNDDQSKDDGKRWQMEYPKDSKKEILRTAYEDIMNYLRKLTTGLKLGDLLVVGSRKDCAVQRPAHTDTEPTSFEENGAQIPLSIFIGLQKETTIRVYKGSHRWIRGHDGKRTLHKNEGKPVQYGRGDVLIMRGDLVHQGDAFKRQNMRLFIYAHLPGHLGELDADGTEVMRTYPVHFDESGKEEESDTEE